MFPKRHRNYPCQLASFHPEFCTYVIFETVNRFVVILQSGFKLRAEMCAVGKHDVRTCHICFNFGSKSHVPRTLGCSLSVRVVTFHNLQNKQANSCSQLQEQEGVKIGVTVVCGAESLRCMRSTSEPRLGKMHDDNILCADFK